MNSLNSLNLSRILGPIGTMALIATITGLITGCASDVEDVTDEPTAEAAEGIQWNGHYYQFFVSPLIWERARSQCLVNGYQLVSVNSDDEQNWLHQQQSMRGGGYWWLGLSDFVEGTWVWEDGSLFVYRNWKWGEPNNQGNEDCAIDYGLGGFGWNDAKCGSAFKFVCEGTEP